jgi:hypothetical protein
MTSLIPLSWAIYALGALLFIFLIAGLNLWQRQQDWQRHYRTLYSNKLSSHLRWLIFLKNSLLLHLALFEEKALRELMADLSHWASTAQKQEPADWAADFRTLQSRYLFSIRHSVHGSYQFFAEDDRTRFVSLQQQVQNTPTNPVLLCRDIIRLLWLGKLSKGLDLSSDAFQDVWISHPAEDLSACMEYRNRLIEKQCHDAVRLYIQYRRRPAESDVYEDSQFRVSPKFDWEKIGPRHVMAVHLKRFSMCCIVEKMSPFEEETGLVYITNAQFDLESAQWINDSYGDYLRRHSDNSTSI